MTRSSRQRLAVIAFAVTGLASLATSAAYSPPAALPPGESAGPSETRSAPAPWDDPAIVVAPAASLRDRQSVEVTLTGFGPFNTVWISECSSTDDATNRGCGGSLASQVSVTTNASGIADVQFVVRTTDCVTQCVIDATLGEGYGFAYAPIDFRKP